MNSNCYKSAVEGDITPFERYAEQGDLPPVTQARNTVLHVHLISASSRSTEFVSFIVRSFPGLIFDTNLQGDSPLHIAARYGLSDVVRLLMAAAAPDTGDLLCIRNHKGDTALHEAVRNNRVLDVALLLECQDDISEVLYKANDLNESPVYIAASKGYYQIILRLIGRYRLPDKIPGGEKSVLIGAVLSGNSEILQLILESQPQWLEAAVDEHGWTPLHYAANGNDKRACKIAEKLLEFNSSVAYFVDHERRTALHMAACRGNVRIMRVIMSACPDCIQLTDSKGWNVLHYAVVSESDAALKFVIQIQNPLRQYLSKERDIQGNTPLHLLAVSRDFLPSFLDVKLLKNFLSAAEFPFADCDSLPLFRRRLLDDLLQPEELVLEWMNDVGKAPSGIDQIVSLNHIQKLRKQSEEEMAERLDRAKDYHLVVASLVAAVTFAAVVTVPGGFIGDDGSSKPTNGTLPTKGTPVLRENGWFIAFFLFNEIAMALSSFCVFLYIIMAILNNKRRYDWLMRLALRCIVFALAAMVAAFSCASAAVTDLPIWIFIAFIALVFLFNVVHVIEKIVVNSINRNREDRSIFESLRSIWRRSPFTFCKSF